MLQLVEYITVDSSVFVSAFGQRDKFTKESRHFLKETSKNPNIKFVLPTVIVAEVIVSLRKQKKINLNEILDSLFKYKLIPIDREFLEQYYLYTKNPTLKTSDLIIAATAKINDAILVSWDRKHLSKAQKICKALSPAQYLKQLTS